MHDGKAEKDFQIAVTTSQKFGQLMNSKTYKRLIPR